MEPHYFEPLSEDDWQRSGFEIPTPPPGDLDPRDMAFVHAYSVITDVEEYLEQTPSGEGLGLNYEIDWTYYSYVFIVRTTFALHRGDRSGPFCIEFLRPCSCPKRFPRPAPSL
jgi:hypothetical protein